MSNLEDLIELGRETTYIPCAYSELWSELFIDWKIATPRVGRRVKKLQKTIRDHLHGETLVDLGSGIPTPEVIGVVQQSGVARYVAVDLHVFANQSPSAISIDGVDTLAVHDDMLAFATQLLDASSNFMINGFDDAAGPRDYRYHQKIAEVIVQKTKPAGIIFVAHSEVANDFLRNDQLAILDWRERDRDWWGDNIFVKK